MVKRLFVLSLLLSLLALPALADTSRVADEANLLSAAQEQQLQERIDSIVQQYDIDVAIVTVNSIGYRSPGLYAADFYDEHGYGVGDDRSGLIFLICMGSRDYFTAVTGDAQRIFDQSTRDNIHEDVVPHLSGGRYAKAFEVYLNGVEEALQAHTPEGRFRRMAPIILLAGVGIGCIVAFSLKRQLKSVRRKQNAASYVVNGSFQLTRFQDIYLYTTTTRRKIETNYGGGGSGGGSFRSSSGRSFSGSGGKF